MFNKHTNVKEVRITHYDFLKDKVVIEGKIYRRSMVENLYGFFDFKLIATNCTQDDSTKIRYSLEMMSSKKVMVNKGCFGRYKYFITKTTDAKKGLEVNYLKNWE